MAVSRNAASKSEPQLSQQSKGLIEDAVQGECGRPAGLAMTNADSSRTADSQNSSRHVDMSGRIIPSICDSAIANGQGPGKDHNDS
jgi:hypothetical protein